MFYTSQRTLFNMDLQLALMLGVPYKPQANTTLNEKLDIIPGEQINDGVYPTLKYMCIGCGGNTLVDVPTSYPYSQHQPFDASLFKIMPFVIREASNDLSDNEKTKYRLRKSLTINNTAYYAYYLKYLDVSRDITYKDDFYQISHRGSTDTIDVFPLSEKNPLNPTPVSKNGKVLSSNSVYVTKLAKIKIELLEDEIRELDNVFTIMRDSLFPGVTGVVPKVITEIGFCTGIDKVLPTGLTEASNVQIGFHIGMTLDVEMSIAGAQSIYKVVELGGTEPLLGQ